MRVSTAWWHMSSVLQMQEQQFKLSRTQEQIASGKRVVRPSDDPISSVRALELGRALDKTEQFQRNANIAQNRLNLQESVLVEAGNLVQRARELTVQGANGSQGNDSRKFIAQELRELRASLLELANSQDSADQYLFAGFQSNSQPFVTTPNGVEYRGDDGKRALQIGPNRNVTDGNPGSEVFQQIRQGNGVFIVEADTGNQGTAVVKNTSIRDLQQWTGEPLRVEILADSEYEILDEDDNVIAAGDYRAGEAISVNGIEFIIEGNPEEGDSFSIEPSRNQGMFVTLDRLIEGLEMRVENPRDRALQLNELNRSLEDLDQVLNRVLEVRAETGARLKAVDDQREVNEGTKLNLTTTRSELEDLDYAEAITRLNQQQVGLQAAQQAYVRVQGLSLFNFL